MKKRVVSLLLCLIMALSLIPTAAFATEVADVENEVVTYGKDDKHDKDDSSDTRYYSGNYKFGYDAWTYGGSLTGLASVKVGDVQLTQKSATSTTGAAVTNGITVNLQAGYYIAQYKYVCGDKYSCRTDAAGKATSGSNVRPGDDTASVTLEPQAKDFNHTSKKDPYWLLLELGQDTTKYKVTYDWGILADDLKASVPVDNGKYLVSELVTVQAPSTEATAEATNLNYKFKCWTADFDDTTYYKPKGQFGMPQQNVTLTAQWEMVEAPATGNLIITKNVEGDVTLPTDGKTFTFVISGGDLIEAITVDVIVDAKTKTGTGSVKNKLTVGETYTVREKDANIDGYKLTTNYAGTTNGSDVTIGDANTTIGVTNTYEKVYGDDQINPASLTINKVDSKNLNKVLPGAEFTLTKQGATTGVTKTTDENGTCTFDNLDVGFYTLTETKAPAGYKTTDKTWTIKVEKDTDSEEIALDETTNKFVKHYNCAVFELVGNALHPLANNNNTLTITNDETPKAITATLDITKNVVRERGSRRPGSADFTFKASYVDPSNKEKEVLVELSSLTIKTTGGEKSYTEGWTLTIPEKAFDEDGWAVLVISEVNGKLSGWTYDKEVYTLYVSKNGEIFNGGIPQALNGDEEVVPGINLKFTNSYYKRTSSPNPPENKPVKSVKTGDMGIAMYAMTSLLSLGGAALVIKKRKDEE